jgi:Ca2+-binding RTX toxin-like protein
MVEALAPAGGNSAPELASALADQAAQEDAAFAFTVAADAFSDPDAGDGLTYSATLEGGAGLPAWLSFEAETRTFSGTPLQADVGALEVTVTATDSGGLSASDTFALTIENVNDAPIVAAPVTDLSFEAGASFSFGLFEGTFTDEDPGDTHSLSATRFDGSALPAWLSFDPATAIFTGNPATSDIGISHILVTAADGVGATAQADFGLVVRVPAGTEATGSAGDDVIYGGTGDETLTAKGGSDYLYGDAGNDLLKGGGGNDVLQGGAGSDVLRGGKGQNVLDGGDGDDLIFGGQGSAFIVGGAGNDTLRVGSGNDVIAFNAGDGMDTVYGGRDGGNTLSFGGGIRYSDLALSKVGKDLVVSMGAGEGVTLKNWYTGNHSVLNLQIVLDATEEFDAGSADPLYNRRVQTFDFLGMVSAFDTARAATPGLTSWEITNALLAFHLSGADDMALGGDLAYWYGKNRTLAGISLQSAQQVIGAAGFGSEAQSLRPFSGLQEGFVKLA